MKHYIGDLKKQQVLTTIHVNFKEQDQLSWENETEFIYKHNLFDLVEKKETKDGLIITCLADKNEESLVKSFKNFNDQSYPSHTSSGSLLKLINQTFLTTETLTFNRIDNNKSLLTPQHTIHLPSQLRFVLIPPPKMVS